MKRFKNNENGIQASTSVSQSESQEEDHETSNEYSSSNEQKTQKKRRLPKRTTSRNMLCIGKRNLSGVKNLRTVTTLIAKCATRQ